MNSDSSQPVQEARWFCLKRQGTNLLRPGFVAMYCVVLFVFCLTVLGEIIASQGELGPLGWLLVLALAAIPTAWLSVQLRECYTLRRGQPTTSEGVGIKVDSISHRLRHIQTNYLVPFSARHHRPGHDPARVASARRAVRSRSFFAPQPSYSHEETHEHGIEI